MTSNPPPARWRRAASHKVLPSVASWMGEGKPFPRGSCVCIHPVHPRIAAVATHNIIVSIDIETGHTKGWVNVPKDVAAIWRDREGLFDLFVAGGSHEQQCAAPSLEFATLKAALRMRRADLALRLLAGGAPPYGARGDHRLVDRVVAVWCGWLRTSAVDVAAKMRAGAAVRVANSSLKKGERLASHQASALRLDVAHALLWRLYTSRHVCAGHEHCPLADVVVVAPEALCVSFAWVLHTLRTVYVQSTLQST